jgi:hypothetical protein
MLRSAALRFPVGARVALLLTAALPTTVALSAMPVLAQERPLAPEKSPPGDIPDDQVFITYRSPRGFSLKVPEGWARREGPAGVSFEDKYGRIEVALLPADTAPTAAEVAATEVPELVNTGHAVKIGSVTDVRLPSGPAVRIAFTSNSEPNPVTNKRIRLESERFLIAHGGERASLTLSAPAGADNADQWKLMADSFRWN